jgi:hypothetical protein
MGTDESLEKECFYKELTPIEFEQEYGESLTDTSKPVKNNFWAEFVSFYRAGDRIKLYSTPIEDWDALCGCEWVALIRDERTIFTIDTAMN